jgi:hypothetical protein
MTTSIYGGGLVSKDPDSIEVFSVDWDRRLAPTVTIATSTWLIEGIDAVLTKTSPSILSDSRSTQVVLSAGTLGVTYIVINRIVTNEIPAQTMDEWFAVLMEN